MITFCCFGKFLRAKVFIDILKKENKVQYGCMTEFRLGTGLWVDACDLRELYIFT